MTLIAFEEWRPDLAPINAGSANALNVIRVQDGYEVIFSPEPIGFVTLEDYPKKLFVGVSSAGVKLPIVLCENASYRGTGNSLVMCAGSDIGPSEDWSYTQYGDFVYAVDGRNQLRKISIDANGEFQLVPVDNGLSARFIATVAQFVMLADIREFDGNDRYPFRLKWSGLQRPDRYENQPNAIQSDFQDIQDIGTIRGLTGGEFAIVLGSIGIARGDYVGPDIIFKFTTIETNVGCDIPNSVVRTGDQTFFWSNRGWRVTNGGVSQAIGVGKVDLWFRRTLDAEYINRFSSIVLANYPIVMWSFVSVFSVDKTPDTILAYNWEQESWTYGPIRAQILGTTVLPPVYTDDDNLPLSGYVPGESTTDDYDVLTDTDVNIYEQPAAMVDGSLCRLVQSGNIEAQLETREFAIDPNNVKRLGHFMPVVHSATDVIGKVKSRDTQTDEVYRIRDNLKRERSGRISCRSNARFFTIGLRLSGPFKRALGVDAQAVEPVASKR